MEDADLRNIWQDYDRQMEASRLLNQQSWALNLQCFYSLQIQKAKYRLDSLVRFKVRAFFLGLVWIIFLALLIYGNHFENGYFVFSVGMILLISVVATFGYLIQIRQIRRLDYSENIVDTQRRLASLQLSTLQLTRISWLQLPFYTTWFWHRSWVDLTSLHFWLTLFPITLFFFLLSFFLYRNISIGRMDKRWVRALMMAGPEYKSLLQAKKFVDEIEDSKKHLLIKKEFVQL